MKPRLSGLPYPQQLCGYRGPTPDASALRNASRVLREELTRRGHLRPDGVVRTHTEQVLLLSLGHSVEALVALLDISGYFWISIIYQNNKATFLLHPSSFYQSWATLIPKGPSQSPLSLRPITARPLETVANPMGDSHQPASWICFYGEFLTDSISDPWDENHDSSPSLHQHLENILYFCPTL